LPLTFVADENVESQIVEALIGLGYTVDHSATHLSAGAPDEAVLDLSARTERHHDDLADSFIVLSRSAVRK
jgi:hypothetical protein